MTPQMWITLGVLVVAIILFVTEWLRVDVVALLVVVALILTDILTVNEAIAGFSSTAVITIAALFIVGGGVFQSGLAAMIGQRILRVAGESTTSLIVMIMAAVALMSGFISDTGVVALMLPALVSVSASTKIPPGKLLIPMAVGSLLGGASTLIGTPPNIIVAEVLLEAGLEPFGFFSFTPLGVVLIAVGIAFMVFVGQYLLPNVRPSDDDSQLVESPMELVELYQLPENLFKLRVRSISSLIGKSVKEGHFGSRYDVSVISVKRTEVQEAAVKIGPQTLSASSSRDVTLSAEPDLSLLQDDILIVQGQSADIKRAAEDLKLEIQHTSSADYDALVSEEIGVVEVVLPPRSSLIGQTLADVRFGRRYRLTVLTIDRPGSGPLQQFKETKLRFGDTLLVQGAWVDIQALKKQRRDFVVMGDPDHFSAQSKRRKAPVVLAILVAMLIAIVSGVLPVAAASMSAALLMVLTGCLTMDDAYRAIDWKSLLLIAGMLPMATALQKVGLVDAAAHGFTATLGGFGPVVIMAGLMLLTTTFTQVLSNTATAVLIAPIALATAQQLDVSPYAFLMGVAVAASFAFASPVASPVNTLVMGAGDYTFSDYVKIGLPLIGITTITALLLLPLLFPF